LILHVSASAAQLAAARAGLYGPLPVATPGDLAALSSFVTLLLHSALQFHELDVGLDPFAAHTLQEPRELDDDSRWISTLTHPLLQSLRVIRLNTMFLQLRVGEDSMAAMVALPHLHTLELQRISTRILHLRCSDSRTSSCS